MYTSLFERLKNYTSNPIDEFNKICSFLDDAVVEKRYETSLHDLLSDAFLYCKELRCFFISFDDCIESNCANLKQYSSPAKSYYQSLSGEEKENLLDDFLTYCQIISTCLVYLDKNINAILNNHYCNTIDNKVVDQFTELIVHSLKSFNYECVLNKDNLNIDIKAINPIAEVVASESSNDISNAITGYLGNRDIKTKEKYLHDFIDLLEPALKKYSDQSLIKKIKEYIQLLRHPEIKKEENKYEWYFNNKRKYIDKLFELCLLVQQYDLSKSIVAEFENNKTK